MALKWNENTKVWETIIEEIPQWVREGFSTEEDWYDHQTTKIRASLVTGWTTKDSGQRREFGTGSVRDVRTGKGRFDLLWWEFIRRMAGIMERGAEKYGDRNWEKGQPVMSSYDSCIRHLGQAGEGLEDEDHMAAVAVNAMFMAFTIEMINRGILPEELDDRPKYIIKSDN